MPGTVSVSMLSHENVEQSHLYPENHLNSF